MVLVGSSCRTTRPSFDWAAVMEICRTTEFSSSLKKAYRLGFPYTKTKPFGRSSSSGLKMPW
jgi:hypothetical protein